MNPDFDAIKRTADLVRVIEDHGVILKKQGADYVGLCPFHEDTKPSLRVTPAKGLWHCMACGKAGNPIAPAVYMMIGCWPSTVGPIQLAWDANDQIEVFDVTFQYQWWQSASTS